MVLVLFAEGKNLMPWLNLKYGSRQLDIPTIASVSIMEVLQDIGVSELGECGGLGTCGKCRILVRGEVSEAADAEREFLTAEELAQGWRLACHTRVKGDCEAEIGQVASSSQQDLTALREEAAEYLAIDLGSTTIVIAAVNKSGQIISQLAFANPQRLYGSDVLSRLSYALKGSEYREVLRRLVVNSINRQLESINTTQVKAMAVVGNPAMMHLFLGAEVKGLATYPYQGVITSSLTLSVEEAGLDLSSRPTVFCPPPAGLYVGSDALVGLASLPVMDNFLLVDLGTNAEVMVKSQASYWAVSAAAGPAFEGASIYQGMRAGPGAITGLDFIEGKVQLQVIGNEPPRGISGSGLVNLIGRLREHQIINGEGVINPLPGAEILVREGHQGREIVLYEDLQHTVVLTQEDIRQFQLAKAAVRVAVDTLLAQLPAANWQAIYLAGALGSNLAMKDLLRLGVLPLIDGVPVIAAGNTALSGAVRVTYDQQFRDQVEQIATRIKVLELANQPGFQEAFIKQLSL